jgi:hypothetical protein
MRQRGWLAGVVVVAALWGGEAWAGVGFDRVQVTEVSVPSGALPSAALVTDEEGAVFLLSNPPGGAVFLIPVTLGEGAGEAIKYEYGEEPVALGSWTFGPEGDFLLRGNTLTPEGEPLGVTARVTRQGEVKWEVPDSNFSGSEEFIGRYVQATGPVVWSPIAQRALVFTEASFDVAPVSQGTMLFEFNGDVRDPSVLFGEEYIGATLNNALRTPQGKFLVYYYSQNDRGTRFYIYDGVSNISLFTPEGGDWGRRVVYQVQYDPSQNLILLWNELDDESNPIASRLTKLDPEGKLLWEVDLSGSIPLEVEDPVTGLPVQMSFDLLRPVFLVAAEGEVVLLRQAGEGFFFDVRAGDDGSPAGFFDFFALTENQVFDLKFLPGSEGNYLLSTVNPDRDDLVNELLQVKLVYNNSPVVIGENVNNDGGQLNNLGGENNGPIAEEPEGEARPKIPEVGCGCAQPGSRVGGGWRWLWGRRR